MVETVERDRVRLVTRSPHKAVLGVLVALIATYIVVFGRLTWAQQSNYGTFGFDMGIYDQAIWLLSRFKTPFVTVRGLNYFGHHVNPITLLFVPAYWLGAGPHLLYLVETIALAAGAVPVWLFARDQLGHDGQALIFSAAYLLYPSLEWINWWHFHPDALIITPLLFAWWFASRRRWLGCGAAATVALLCKEDAALGVAMLGLLMVWRFRGPGPGRRLGALLAVVGALWFAVCVRVIIPAANGGRGAFYEASFPSLGQSLGEIAYNAVRHPSRLVRLVIHADRRPYYLKVLAPVAFLALGSGLALIGVPQMLVNVASGVPYTYDIRYHYTSIIVAAVFLAAIDTCRRWGRRVAVRWVLVALVGGMALVANVAWSPSPLGVKFHSGIWVTSSDRTSTLDAAVALIPPESGVTATYSIVPHLTHRVHIYEWPNPFFTANWGLDNARPDPATNVDAIVLDTNLNTDHADLFDRLVSPGGGFAVVRRWGTIVLARRITPTSPPFR